MGGNRSRAQRAAGARPWLLICSGKGALLRRWWWYGGSCGAADPGPAVPTPPEERHTAEPLSTGRAWLTTVHRRGKSSATWARRNLTERRARSGRRWTEASSLLGRRRPTAPDQATRRSLRSRREPRRLTETLVQGSAGRGRRRRRAGRRSCRAVSLPQSSSSPATGRTDWLRSAASASIRSHGTTARSVARGSFRSRAVNPGP